MDDYLIARKSGSFGGVQSLHRYSRKPIKEVKKWLMRQNAYTLHKPTRLRFERRKTFAKGIDDLFQADLVDLSGISSYNDGYRYLLTCIDVFSKYAWAIPLKSKSAESVKQAFEKILMERKCNMLQTDKGSEFLNVTVQNLFKQNDVHHYTSENEDIKAAVVERFNRTLKSKMWKYFTHVNTRKFIDVLDDLLDSYNSSYHRSIGMAPNQVTTENAAEIAKRLYPHKRKPTYRYELGDKVRISKGKHVFKRGYMPNWSEEIFTIQQRYPTDPGTYGIVDYDGEPIKGKFYEQELQKVIKEDDVYEVEEILKTRRRDNKTEHFVKWKGYPSKFNSWKTLDANAE